MRRHSELPPSAVVDINLFVSGSIRRSGVPYELLQEWRNRSFALILSRQLRRELGEVLRRTKFAARLTPTDIADLLAAVDVTTTFVRPRSSLPVEVRDPKDRIVLATALGGRADFLVTGDQDLLVLKGDPALGSLQIVTAGSFLAHLRQTA